MKSRVITILALAISPLLVVQEGDDGSVPKIGDRVEIKERAKMLMISSGQMSPSTEVRYGQIAYSIAVDGSDRVIFVSSSSPAFVTPEGLSIESTLEQVLLASGSEVMEERGWGHYVRLPSGWCAGFFVWRDDTPGGSGFAAPDASSRVNAFFQR